MVVDPLLRGLDGEELEPVALDDKGRVVAGKFMLELDGRELKLLMLEDIAARTILLELDG